MSRAANTVPLTDWEPDRSSLAGAAQEAKGVISQAGRYAPLQDLTAYKAGAAMAGACIGARGFWSSSGTVNIFTGSDSDLFKLVSREPTIVSKSGGYTASAPDGWQFEQFGDFVVAVNSALSPQVYELGVSSLFADLAGSPPTAKTVFRVGNQLVLANNRTLSVSGFNNIELWDYATATQGVQVDVDQRGGNIQTGVGGEVGLIFQERGIIRMTYLGPPTVFQLDTVDLKHGAISRESVSQYGRNTFFVSETGFFVHDGMTATPLGQNKVDKYFADNLNYAARNRVSCAIDFARKLWIVAFPTSGSRWPNELLIYSLADNRWTHDEIETQILFEMPREGITVDDATGIFALEGTVNADEITTSVDDPQWRETRVQAAAVDSTGAVSTFEGTNRAATMTTTEFEPVRLKRTYIDEVWPEIDIDSSRVVVTAELRKRNAVAFLYDGSPMTWGVGNRMFWGANTDSVSSDMNDHGFAPFRLNTRYVKFKIDVAADTDWSEATGLHWRGSEAGER